MWSNADTCESFWLCYHQIIGYRQVCGDAQVQWPCYSCGKNMKNMPCSNSFVRWNQTVDMRLNCCVKQLHQHAEHMCIQLEAFLISNECFVVQLWITCHVAVSCMLSSRVTHARWQCRYCHYCCACCNRFCLPFSSL